jgi:small-conductance mechanosensitive channel
MGIEDLLSYSIWGNTLGNYVIAVIVFGLVLIISRIVKYVIVKKLRTLTEKTKSDFDDLLIRIIDKIGWSFYVFFSLYFASKFIYLPSYADVFFFYSLPVVTIYVIIKSVQNVIGYGTRKLVKGKEADTSVINILSRILQGALWGIGVIYLLSAFGYDITTVIAGFGVIGIAVAFGLQHVLSDIFASFSIFFDKPFALGDFIIVGDNLGTVKKIGIKSTRLQSLWGQEVVIPNKELTSSRISNYKKMKSRRVQFSFGVEYNTSAEKLEKISEIAKEIFNKIKLTDLDRIHFKEYGEYSLNFEVVYYVNTPDYNKYMDIQQEVNLSLKKRFEKEKINFAYPTHKIILNKKK